MRLILAHNFYSSATPSGENIVFEAEKKLLTQHGHEVKVFSKYSDDILAEGKMGVIKTALSIPWNFSVRGEILKDIDNLKPDVVHVHNTFPLISPSIFHSIGRRAARVLTLHNYRLFCPAAIPMRNGKVCTKCLDNHSVVPAVMHGCYRNSRIATAPLALSVGLHRAIGTWAKEVDAFITLSSFQRELMIEAGLPREKVHVKPNFYPGNPRVVPWSERKPYIVFVGRLTAEKGVISLIKAWREWGQEAPELRIVGDGGLRQELELMAHGLPIRFLGQVDSREAEQQIAYAQLQILPSEWFEGFPMVIREAFAFGTPAAVSDIGPLASIVQNQLNGVVFEPANPKSLLHEVRSVWNKQGHLEYLGNGARIAFETNYTEDANYLSLMSIYQQAIKVSRNE